MMAIPIIQHIQNEYASTPVESYSYHNEMVRFVGSNAFIGFDGNMFPVSWHVFEANPNYSPGPQTNPFAVSTNNTNTSAPLIEETFSNYSTTRIESVWQNSAVMIKWNHYVKIAEIFSFTNNGIDASIVVKNLNVTNTYISTFSLGMGVNSTMNVNGFNPSCQNISSGTDIIPSSDWNVSVGNISINWQSEDSIFHSGIVSETSLGDQIILPFETGVINHNQSYTIDPMIYYYPRPIFRSPPPPPPPLQFFYIYFDENGLQSGTSWSVTVNGYTKSSTSSSIAFIEQNHGSYSYSIGSVNDYSGPSPQSGSVYIDGGSKTISVAYKSAFPPSLGYMHISLITDMTQNFTQQDNNARNISGNSYIVCGAISTLEFSIPYFDATSGNSNWGITLYIENVDGSLTAIGSSSNINGNSIASFSWIAKPGIYEGFKVVFTNEYGSTSATYAEPFDVSSGLVSSSVITSNNPCLPDSTASTYYNSCGNIIGYLLLTATIGGHSILNPNEQAHLGLQMSFVSTADNVTNSKYTYGIFNYEQSLNITSSQDGQLPSAEVEPFNSASEVSSTNQPTSSSCCLAEHSIYDLVESGLLLSDYGLVPGLVMASLGPLIFQSAKGGSSTYWSKNGLCGDNYTFYNWIDNSSKKKPANMPPQIKVDAFNNVTGAVCSNDCPVYTVVNNGQGDPSYIQNLNIGLTLGHAGLEYSNQYQLGFFNYSASATIVPIWHLGSGIHFNQNDYAYANWVCTQNNWEPWTYGQGRYEYRGPSYTIATSMQIYFAMKG